MKHLEEAELGCYEGEGVFFLNKGKKKRNSDIMGAADIELLPILPPPHNKRRSGKQSPAESSTSLWS